MTKNTSSSQTSRVTRGLLIGSLALNLLIIGGAVGFMATAEKHRAPPPSSFSVGPFTQALKEEQRQNVRTNLKENMESRRKTDRKEGRKAFSAFLTALRQDPFERESVVSALNAMDAQSKARRMEGTNALLDEIEKMTSEERAAYVERLERALRKKRPAPRKNGS